MKRYFRASLPLLPALWLPLFGQMTLSLNPSLPSPQPLGTVVTWTASVSNSDSGTLEYRFRTRRAVRGPVSVGVPWKFPSAEGDPSLLARLNFTAFRTVEDYGPNPSFAWSTIGPEGEYEIEVTVRDTVSGDTATANALFRLTPLAAIGSPVITPTAHPLVFIYSAPPCPLGSRMRVEFRSPDGFVQRTPYKACDPQLSMNFYLAGMRAETPYAVQHTIGGGGSAVRGPLLTLTTPPVSIQPPATVALTDTPLPSTQGVLLQSLLGGPSIATDLSGNIVWYDPTGVSVLTRPQAGGTFMGFIQDFTQGPSQQFVREFDLAGNTVAETNAARINEQLSAMGMHAINSFHHEARKLPGGGYLVLAESERMLTDVQGAGPVDVIGDTILVLDANLQVTWAWDSFDHLDTYRMAVLGETCNYPISAGCPPYNLAPEANDWLHGNSLSLTPDGNILYSMRHQDWIVKIDYRYGAGTGAILWRLGQGGDFQIESSDPSPWFSHQHDANFEADGTTMTLFDDGNTRATANPQAHSRGQVLAIDESKRTATLVLNADLGTYSYALGSAQHLTNGDYHFDSGAEPTSVPGSVLAQSLEVDPSGHVVYGIQFATFEYRSFRMRDLYTTP